MRHTGRLLFATIMIVAMLFLGSSVSVLAEDEDLALDCIPFAQSLADRMDVDCDYLMKLHGQGVGFGQIMMAWNLSQMAPDEDLTWKDLLQWHLDGQGWGQLKMAFRLASRFDADPMELLARKMDDGLGWGQIKQAYALAGADLGLSVEDVLARMEQGLGWGEIRDELGIAPGPPPWAGGPKQNQTPSQNGRSNPPGPPPWAGGPGGRGRP